MQRQNAIKKLKEMGYLVRYGTYKYWNNVPYVFDTYLTFDLYINNSQSIRYDEEKATFDYILYCITKGKKNLGVIDYDNYQPYIEGSKIYNLHR